MSVRRAGIKQAPYKPTYGAPTISGGAFYPPADNTYDLGSAALSWKDLYLDGVMPFDPVWVIAGDNTTPRVAHLKKSRGTVAVPTVIVTGDILADISADGYDGSAYLQAA